MKVGEVYFYESSCKNMSLIYRVTSVEKTGNFYIKCLKKLGTFSPMELETVKGNAPVKRNSRARKMSVKVTPLWLRLNGHSDLLGVIDEI